MGHRFEQANEADVDATVDEVWQADALYRFIRGFGGPMLAAHHLFAADSDGLRAGCQWQDWLGRVLG